MQILCGRHGSYIYSKETHICTPFKRGREKAGKGRRTAQKAAANLHRAVATGGQHVVRVGKKDGAVNKRRMAGELFQGLPRLQSVDPARNQDTEFRTLLIRTVYVFVPLIKG